MADSEEPDEATALADFLSERDIDVSDTGSDDSEGASSGEDYTPPPAAPPQPVQATLSPEDAYELRRSARLERELASTRAYLDTFLAALQTGEQAQQEPEAPPDVFSDPQKWGEKLVEPLRQQIDELNARNQALWQLEQQKQAQAGQVDFVQTMQTTELNYEQQVPGYFSRLEEYAEQFRNDLIMSGMNPHQAQQALLEEIMHTAASAARNRQNPAALLDLRASRYLGVDDEELAIAQPSQPTYWHGQQRPPARNGAVGAARRAQEQGTTSSIVQGAGSDVAPLSLDAIKARGLSPNDVANLFQRGGRQAFLEAMSVAERGRR